MTKAYIFIILCDRPFFNKKMIKLINKFLVEILDPEFYVDKGKNNNYQNYHYRSMTLLCRAYSFEVNTIDKLYCLLFQTIKKTNTERKDTYISFAYCINLICIRILDSSESREELRKISLLVHSTVHYQTNTYLLYNGIFDLLLYRSLYGKDEMYDIFCTFIVRFINDSIPDLKYIKGFLIKILLEEKLNPSTIDIDRYYHEVRGFNNSIGTTLNSNNYNIVAKPLLFFMPDQKSTKNFSKFLYSLCYNIEVLIKFKDENIM